MPIKKRFKPKMPKPMKFTVCTATLNRAHTLHRVFNSLNAQTFQDFEWLVIDDGSSDDTERLITEWQSNTSFQIRYKYQQNQGKHIAINLGAKLALGDLFVVADSDDAFLPNALEVFYEAWLAIPKTSRNDFVGVTGLCVTDDGMVIGDRFPEDILDTTSLEVSYRHRVGGEKWGCYRTDIMRQFPSPSIEGLPFFSESVIWHAIGRRYLTRFINKPLRIYKQDAGDQLTRRSPKDTAPAGIFYVMSLNNDHDYMFVAPLFFARIAAHGVRFALHRSERFGKQLSQLSRPKLKALWMAAYLPGFILYVADLISERGRGSSS